MIIEHYQEFRECEKKGLKKQASKSLRTFIASFENSEDIDEWVWRYLPTLETNRHSRIRHEIFHELVYPVLKSGYENNDYSSTLLVFSLTHTPVTQM